MPDIPYGTQLSFWNDLPSSTEIIFEPTYCVKGCPFNDVYEARGDGFTIYVQQFGTAVMEPTKYLLAVQKDKARYRNEKVHYEVKEDEWSAFRRIEALTGKYPMWRMGRDAQDLPSNYSSYGEKC